MICGYANERADRSVNTLVNAECPVQIAMLPIECLLSGLTDEQIKAVSGRRPRVNLVASLAEQEAVGFVT